MSLQGTIQQVFNIAGFSFGSNVTKTATGAIAPQSVALNLGKVGTISSGPATLAADHGITTGQIADVYFSAGIRYGCTVGTVSGTSVPLTSGAGTALPSSGAVTLCVQTVIDVDFASSKLEMIAIQCDAAGHVNITDNSDASLLAVALDAGAAWSSVKNTGWVDPIGGAVGKVKASTSSATGATLVVAGLYDSTT